MNLDEIFMRDILENPEDDTTRLVYADWLEEHARPERAEFLRLECRLRRVPEARPEVGLRTRPLWKRLTGLGGFDSARPKPVPQPVPEDRLLRERLGVLSRREDVHWLAAVCRIHLETGPWHDHPGRCPLNVVGPFYTCGQCLACEAPENEAPDLLAELNRGNSTTYFVRQPQTAAEIERACSAAVVCCVADVRYGGTDPKIITRLGNDPLYCDHLLDDASPRLVLAPRVQPF
jgi:uncharacterized protein (TIGR02996 family)